MDRRRLAHALQRGDRRSEAVGRRALEHRHRHQPGLAALVGGEAMAAPSRGDRGPPLPDIVSDGQGGYLVTYQSDPGATPPSQDQSRLFYRTSTDLRTWSGPHRAGVVVGVGVGRSHDRRGLGLHGHDLLLGFKYSSPTQPDVFELARSTSGSHAGPWRLVGRPDIDVEGGTIENYEFVTAGGQLAAGGHVEQSRSAVALHADRGPRSSPPVGCSGAAGYHGRPLRGVQQRTRHLEHRVRARQLGVPLRCQRPAGPILLPLYAGSDELTQFDGWGHAEIGVVRSTDLVHWQVPPG